MSREESGALLRQHDRSVTAQRLAVLRAVTDGPHAVSRQPPASPARYENRVGDNHHQLICRASSRMVDVDRVVGSTVCLMVTDELGPRDRRGRCDSS